MIKLYINTSNKKEIIKMKILVISDTHGNLDNIRKVIERHDDIENIFHLGDGKADIDLIKDEYKNKVFFRVCGNCDSATSMPVTLTETIEGKRFFLTHGHEFYVKDNLDKLVAAATKENADVALFGHTHTPIKQTINGIIVFNPGSLEKAEGSYGIIEVSKNKLDLQHFDL